MTVDTAQKTSLGIPRIGLIIIGDEVLSAKRQDKHLKQSNALLRPMGLALSWVQILGDEPGYLTKVLKQSFASEDIVFCFGGIGATPDDRTRQCAAEAVGKPLERHPEAVAEIEHQFGDAAYPQRIHMAEYPQGARIIPNEYNRVPGFSYQNHHFMPGFPMMAKPMMAWVLKTYYRHLASDPQVEKTIKLEDEQESDWISFMEQFETKFPSLRLFSLPSISPDGVRSIELGVEGSQATAQEGFGVIIEEANRRKSSYKLI